MANSNKAKAAGKAMNAMLKAALAAKLARIPAAMAAPPVPIGDLTLAWR